MEQFQRFEEEQQIQTYQQPVGFNPVRSVSQGNAIRQQYQQTQQSKQFYNQSIITIFPVWMVVKFFG